MEKHPFRVKGPIKVYWLAAKKRSPDLGPFIKETCKSDISSRKKIQKFFEIFEKSPDTILGNIEKFHKMSGDTDIHEFKPTAIIRLLCFWNPFEENEIIITHGCIKKATQVGSPKEFIADIKRAEDIKEEWQNEQE